MTMKLFQVDAFTQDPFKGNPAAVCLLSQSRPDDWMLALAAEMNLSETAFLLPEGDAWRLRWFTPKTEVSLCGHATLASAKVLFETGLAPKRQPIQFATQSGLLAASWREGKVELDFPIMRPEPVEVDPRVRSALDLDIQNSVRSGNYFLYEAESAEMIRRASPDFKALAESPAPEVIITARSDEPQFDFISRFFAPQLGIDEDPVTGSAHCVLAPYWAEKLGKETFAAYQASARGGVLDVTLAGDRVRIAGYARIIFEADLLV
jgi:PhzF family phenazine biosynthesis protein